MFSAMGGVGPPKADSSDTREEDEQVMRDSGRATGIEWNGSRFPRRSGSLLLVLRGRRLERQMPEAGADVAAAAAAAVAAAAARPAGAKKRQRQRQAGRRQTREAEVDIAAAAVIDALKEKIRQRIVHTNFVLGN
jgi:ribosomal protein L12E/L44/L45/RPP1/RPP2